MWPVHVEPPPPLPDRSQQLDRHAGMWCACPLLDCCHSEMPGDGYAFTHHGTGSHIDSGSPQSGYLYPWEPGDESWRDDYLPPGITPPRTPQR
jgi:hypothetical protein